MFTNNVLPSEAARINQSSDFVFGRESVLAEEKRRSKAREYAAELKRQLEEDKAKKNFEGRELAFERRDTDAAKYEKAARINKQRSVSVDADRLPTLQPTSPPEQRSKQLRPTLTPELLPTMVKQGGGSDEAVLLAVRRTEQYLMSQVSRANEAAAEVMGRCEELERVFGRDDRHINRLLDRVQAAELEQASLQTALKQLVTGHDLERAKSQLASHYHALLDKVRDAPDRIEQMERSIQSLRQQLSQSQAMLVQEVQHSEALRAKSENLESQLGGAVRDISAVAGREAEVVHTHAQAKAELEFRVQSLEALVERLSKQTASEVAETRSGVKTLVDHTQLELAAKLEASISQIFGRVKDLENARDERERAAQESLSNAVKELAAEEASSQHATLGHFLTLEQVLRSEKSERTSFQAVVQRQLDSLNHALKSEVEHQVIALTSKHDGLRLQISEGWQQLQESAQKQLKETSTHIAHLEDVVRAEIGRRMEGHKEAQSSVQAVKQSLDECTVSLRADINNQVKLLAAKLQTSNKVQKGVWAELEKQKAALRDLSATQKKLLDANDSQLNLFKSEMLSDVGRKLERHAEAREAQGLEMQHCHQSAMSAVEALRADVSSLKVSHLETKTEAEGAHDVLAATVQSLQRQLNSSVQRLEEQNSAQQQHYSERLATMGEELKHTHDTVTAKLEERNAERLLALELLQTQVESIGTKQVAMGSSLKDELNSQSQMMEQQYKQYLDQVGALEGRQKELSAHLNDQMDHAMEQLHTLSDSARNAIQETNDTLSQHLTDFSEHRESFKDYQVNTEAALGTFTQETADIRANTTRHLKRLRDEFTDGMAHVSDTLRKAEVAREEHQRKSAHVVEQVSKVAQDTREDMKRFVDEEGGRLTKTLSVVKAEIAELRQSSSASVSQMFGEIDKADTACRERHKECMAGVRELRSESTQIWEDVRATEKTNFDATQASVDLLRSDTAAQLLAAQEASSSALAAAVAEQSSSLHTLQTELEKDLQAKQEALSVHASALAGLREEALRTHEKFVAEVSALEERLGAAKTELADSIKEEHVHFQSLCDTSSKAIADLDARAQQQLHQLRADADARHELLESSLLSSLALQKAEAEGDRNAIRSEMQAAQELADAEKKLVREELSAAVSGCADALEQSKCSLEERINALSTTSASDAESQRAEAAAALSSLREELSEEKANRAALEEKIREEAEAGEAKRLKEVEASEAKLREEAVALESRLREETEATAATIREQVQGLDGGLREQMTMMETRLSEEARSTETRLREELHTSVSKLQEDVAASEAKLREEVHETTTKLQEDAATTEAKLKEEVETTVAKLQEDAIAAEAKLREEVGEMQTSSQTSSTDLTTAVEELRQAIDKVKQDAELLQQGSSSAMEEKLAALAASIEAIDKAKQDAELLQQGSSSAVEEKLAALAASIEDGDKTTAESSLTVVSQLEAALNARLLALDERAQTLEAELAQQAKEEGVADKVASLTTLIESTNTELGTVSAAVKSEEERAKAVETGLDGRLKGVEEGLQEAQNTIESKVNAPSSSPSGNDKADVDTTQLDNEITILQEHQQIASKDIADLNSQLELVKDSLNNRLELLETTVGESVDILRKDIADLEEKVATLAEILEEQEAPAKPAMETIQESAEEEKAT